MVQHDARIDAKLLKDNSFILGREIDGGELAHCVGYGMV